MAEEVQFRSGQGKVRSFGTGLLLAIITLGIYYYFWYFNVNKELQRIGESCNDPELAQSKPINSLMAVLIGWILILPPLISVYRYGKRIRRAEGLVGVPDQERLNPVWAFLLVFPFGYFLVPLLGHYWYVTKHQNQVVRGGSIGPVIGGMSAVGLS